MVESTDITLLPLTPTIGVVIFIEVGPPADVPSMWDSSVDKFGDGGTTLGVVEISGLVAALDAIFGSWTDAGDGVGAKTSPKTKRYKYYTIQGNEGYQMHKRMSNIGYHRL